MTRPRPMGWVGVVLVSFSKTQKAGFEYNSLGKVTREIDPLGREKVYTYDSNQIDLLNVKVKNGAGWDTVQSYTYNSQNKPLTVTDGAGQTTTYTYTASGQVETVTTPPRQGISEQRTTTYTYQPGTDRLMSVSAPGNVTTSYTYDGYGRLRTTTDSDNYILTYDYDALDRPTRTTFSDGTFEETQYDKLDPAKRRDRMGRWTLTFYDALRRAIATRDPLGRTITQQWCGCGSLDKLIDPNGNVTTWDRDAQGRVIKETRANGSFKQVVYESTIGQIKKTIDAKGQEIERTYAVDGKLTQTTYANAQIPTSSISFVYDPAHGRLISMTDGTGTTNYTYHPFGQLGAGRVATVDAPLSTDTISYSYDELGRLVSRTLNGVTSTWSYDQQGRQTSQGDPIGTFSYTYDGISGRPASVTYPNGQTTTYAYFPNSGDHRLQQIHHKQPGGATLNKFDYTYDVVGSIKTWIQQVDSNPAQAYELEYDAADQLTAAILKSIGQNPTVLKRYYYAYDPASNRTAEQVDDAVTGATHDNMNRLLSQQPGGTLSFRGTVNEPSAVTVQGQPGTVSPANEFAGAAAVPAGVSNVVVTATDPAGNLRTNTYQVGGSGSTRTFTYDSNGNLASKVESGVTTTYEWDAENRLVAVNQGTLRSEFTYGAGKRVRIVEKDNSVVTADRRFVFDGIAPLEERDPSGTTVVKRFFGLGFQQGGVPFYWVQDHLGSVRDVTDGASTLRARYEYDPWGRKTKVSGDVEADFGFTGHFFHAVTGLHIALHRAYDTNLGRWLSPDPSSRAARTQGPNLYGYVTNSPISFGDVLGLEKVAFHVISVIRGNGIGAGVKTWDRVVVDTDSGAYTRSWALGATHIPVPFTSSVLPVPGRGHLEASASGGQGCVTVKFTGWAATNTAPLANIDYNFTITYNSNKGKGHLSGGHNSYPSYQVLKNGSEIYDFGQGPSTFQLFDAMGMVSVSEDF